MNESMLGIINATNDFTSLGNVTAHRSLAALPFGGRYRLIDFMLSNMVHSGIQSVAIFTGYENRSLMDHLGSGKQWDLDRKRDGLFVFTPNCQLEEEEFGSFSHLARNYDYFKRSRQEYVVVTNANIIVAMNFKPILHRHIATGADITEVQHAGRSLQTYILKKQLLMSLFEQYKDQGYYKLCDIIMEKRHEMHIHSYEFTGYTAVIDSIDSYYSRSMDLLRPEVWQQVFQPQAPVFTKVKDEPPARYRSCSKVRNAIIANGSIIEGTVEGSIVFRAVKVGAGTVIRGSIVMQKSQIGNNCILEHVILDKDVKIEDGTVLIGTPEAPYVVQKGMVQGALMKS
ncbi:sugar phosphate nucleotidyltransferase [Ectobacillus ponti]|uniref:Sugar phosphate nucleotidyltransferase n=1 Tax=Ectobacillus ponti TaxID=2961894 RepID=A0AA42BN56_9BACI|nr:sugar phosphate nucleotidyltransferase [Ectobacillus ponti]MCP8967600.1 sugar phosphate nucleotidyltransferase [Ectobacillus ponti]